MRTVLFVAVVGLAASLFGMPAASQDAAGGEDLFGRGLKDWTRTGSGPTPWLLTADNVLVCGAGGSEQIAPERVFGNGTLTFDYRFRVTGGAAGRRAALYVRRSPEGKGVRLDLGDDCGKLTATFTGSSDREKTVESRPGQTVAMPIGDWNTVEVVLDGRSVMVKVNGKPASSVDQADPETGLIAIAAEGSETEFRRMYWREGK
ncbi:MAG TPA: DUF1080 domain-containing protein [Gemmataceae bacterium]|nr:DUF1080 domain-containing protein [Gemmataceae bacterium]